MFQTFAELVLFAAVSMAIGSLELAELWKSWRATEKVEQNPTMWDKDIRRLSGKEYRLALLVLLSVVAFVFLDQWISFLITQNRF